MALRNLRLHPITVETFCRDQKKNPSRLKNQSDIHDLLWSLKEFLV